MATALTMNKTEYINFVEKIKKEINEAIAPNNMTNDKAQDLVARSFGYKNHIDVLNYFDNDTKEKAANNFLFKRNFYYYLSLQCKTEDPWSKRVLLLVQLIFLIAEYKNYKLSNRSIDRLLPIDVLIRFYKDKKTPDNLKEKIIEYFQEIPGFTNVRKINAQFREQHQFNFPYILIACKMSEAKKIEKEKKHQTEKNDAS